MTRASLSPVTKRDTAALPSPTSIFNVVTALFTMKRYVSKVRCEVNALSAEMGKVLNERTCPTETVSIPFDGGGRYPARPDGAVTNHS